MSSFIWLEIEVATSNIADTLTYCSIWPSIFLSLSSYLSSLFHCNTQLIPAIPSSHNFHILSCLFAAGPTSSSENCPLPLSPWPLPRLMWHLQMVPTPIFCCFPLYMKSKILSPRGFLLCFVYNLLSFCVHLCLAFAVFYCYRCSVMILQLVTIVPLWLCNLDLRATRMKYCSPIRMWLLHFICWLLKSKDS